MIIYKVTEITSNGSLDLYVIAQIGFFLPQKRNFQRGLGVEIKKRAVSIPHVCGPCPGLQE